MQSMNYDLMQCSIMGISDYLRNPKGQVPRWMNKDEIKAYKLGFNRAKEQCKYEYTTKK